ncbi:MAG: MATE family efflux transporter, partial [Firmicutes bacterium]|nr:MATE family efflux transporter [Bacillota bacterium]
MSKVADLIEEVVYDKEFFHKMLKISLPIMMQNFISSFLNMIDTVMVGKLGETEIAAVGIANQYFFFFNMFLIGLCAGCGVFIAQFWGKGDIKNIKRIMGVGLISAIVVSLIFMFLGLYYPGKVIALFNNDQLVIDLGIRYLKIVIVSYIFTGITFVYNFSLRSIGKTTLPMVVSVVALLCNAFLNYVLIFGKFGAPAMGVEGAAHATVIARVVETILLVAIVYLTKEVLAASIRELADINFEFVKKSYRTIFPVILNDICWGLASLVYVAVYGRMGTQAVAAIQICNTINSLFMVVTFGMSSAAAVMVGHNIGAGKECIARDYAKRFTILAVLMGIALGVLLALTSPLILNIFNVSPAVRSSSQVILYIVSILFFARVLGITLIVGILRGGGDAKQAFLIEGFTMWFIGVPLTIVGAFVFKFPVHLVYALAMVE